MFDPVSGDLEVFVVGAGGGPMEDAYARDGGWTGARAAGRAGQRSVKLGTAAAVALRACMVASFAPTAAAASASKPDNVRQALSHPWRVSGKRDVTLTRSSPLSRTTTKLGPAFLWSCHPRL